jgi:hypothetical protein
MFEVGCEAVKWAEMAQVRGKLMTFIIMVVTVGICQTADLPINFCTMEFVCYRNLHVGLVSYL